MELRTLRYFVAVAEELHFGRAARRVNIAQPPLSQQIQKLESELGTQLLERTKRDVRLTPAGAMFLESARLILRQTQAAIAAVRETGTGLVGHLKIGLINTVSFHSQLFFALRQLRLQHPGVAVTLKIMNSAEQIMALETGQIHIGFVRMPVKSRSLVLETVLTERLFVALPPGHPLAGETGPIRTAELAQENFVLLPRSAGFGLSEHTLQLCKKAGFFPQVVQEVAEPQMLTGLVQAGFGVAFVPETTQALPRSGVVYRPLEPTETVDVAMAFPRTDKATGTEELLAILRDEHLGEEPPAGGLQTGGS